MSDFALTFAARKNDVSVDTLRSEGSIPAVMYGHGIDTLHVSVNASNFEKVYKGAGESTLIDATIEGGETVKVLIKDVQRDTLTHQILHVDFYQVNMKEKITAEVELMFTGEAPAVKTYSGVLVTNLDSVEVECLPQDLIHEIAVDLSSLEELDQPIRVSDLTVPEAVKITLDPQEVVAIVKPPRVAEVDTPAAPTAAETEAKEAEAKEGSGDKKAEDSK